MKYVTEIWYIKLKWIKILCTRGNKSRVNIEHSFYQVGINLDI